MKIPQPPFIKEGLRDFFVRPASKRVENHFTFWSMISPRSAVVI
jgi:hypothetical protein